jgi:hypothetical protein
MGSGHMGMRPGHKLERGKSVSLATPPPQLENENPNPNGPIAKQWC